MSRIDTTLAGLKQQGRKALIPYLMAGFPEPAHTLSLMHALVQGGADIIELGVPFSDPMADGPVIQKAGEAALRHGVGMGEVLDMVRTFRAKDTHTPIVLMGYANPIERMGQSEFVRRAKEAGADGAIVVDYPPEECEAFAAEMKRNELDLIFLLAPTSTVERVKQVARHGSGFSYYVSLKGVTGAGGIDTEDVARRVAAIREHVKLPIEIGRAHV